MPGLYLTSLNSGSNGNCYYIGNDEEAVLIDAGLSCRETEKRMSRLGLSLKKIKAIFISHEHSDHIKGLEVLSRKHQLPVYISPETLRHAGLELDPGLVRPLSAGTRVPIGALIVSVFLKHHDAADPHSFTVEDNHTCIGVFTDIGKVCDNIRAHFQRCHAAFLEANYDEVLLENGRYPYHLKKRIRGDRGHLSNKDALDLFLSCRPVHMSHLFLSHLSADNNDPELVHKLFHEQGTTTNIIIASRHEETPVYTICGSDVSYPGIPPAPEQLTLF
ncbi:MBL fold metallo-hydrolase [Niabella drilacis]|uniref:Phosphoribosyl 1,2-cyclic phosphodiesterase n=1 Tax=Niabella drilacis (strain DSM 25811 / CCM 8410 / CCUG 62505 / LMG 26954 / E90) TaxID=1285928 RepID=A0A1G6WZ30_NIADE|nr:MBL fold metallo-hydrolase [Niabella drilacis]SDD71220.1 Phosphoribosyl 1,2-cyclic phosphodiesterase [Niabella drilacis]